MKSGVFVLRLLQLPMSLLFLIAISWVEFVSHLGTSNIGATALRFLAGLLTMFYTACQLVLHTRGYNPYKSGGPKALGLVMEIVLTGLWYASLIVGKLDNDTALGNTDAAIHTPVIISEVGWFAEVILFTMSLALVTLQTIGVTL